MKKGFCSALALGLLVAPMPALAHGLDEVIKGDFEGEVGVHWQREKPRDDDAESFAVGYAAFLYETEPLHGFSLGLGARGSVKLYEREDDQYKDAIQKNFIIPSAFLRYRHDDLATLTLGRQEVDLESGSTTTLRVACSTLPRWTIWRLTWAGLGARRCQTPMRSRISAG